MKTKQIEDRTKNWIFTNLPGANMVKKKCKLGGNFSCSSASVDNTRRDLLNSSYPTEAEFINCFIFHSK